VFISWRYPDCLHARTVFLETKTLKKSLAMWYNRLQHCSWKKCLTNHGCNIKQKSDSTFANLATYQGARTQAMNQVVQYSVGN